MVDGEEGWAESTALPSLQVTLHSPHGPSTHALPGLLAPPSEWGWRRLDGGRQRATRAGVVAGLPEQPLHVRCTDAYPSRRADISG
jgi:hypothetical protein